MNLLNQKTTPRQREPTAALRTTGIIRAALEIAKERADTLSEMRAAYDRGDDAEALRLGRELCGLADDAKSRRVN